MEGFKTFQTFSSYKMMTTFQIEGKSISMYSKKQIESKQGKPKIVGYIHSNRKKITKKKYGMAFVQMEDEEQAVDVYKSQGFGRIIGYLPVNHSEKQMLAVTANPILEWMIKFKKYI